MRNVKVNSYDDHMQQSKRARLRVSLAPLTGDEHRQTLEACHRVTMAQLAERRSLVTPASVGGTVEGSKVGVRVCVSVKEIKNVLTLVCLFQHH